MVFGGGLIIGSFILFTKLTNDVQNNKHLPALHKQLFSIGIGVANGIFIFVLTTIYDIFALKVCDWENHKYESDYENSLIVKSFVFNFVVSYINLFYYAFFNTGVEKEARFGILGTNFVSIILSKNLAFAVNTNILPYFIFLYNRSRLRSKWRQEKKLKKTKFVV